MRTGLDALESDLTDDGTAAWRERVLNAGAIWCDTLEANPTARSNPFATRVAMESAGLEEADFTVITQAAEQKLCPA